MAIREKIAKALLGKKFLESLQKTPESISTGRKEDEGWRTITRDKTRDLTPLTQERMQEIAFHLYDTNPVAHRILEMTKDFVVGEGITFKAANPEVQSILEIFWNDPVNAWDLKQGQRVLELGLFGEQFYPVAVNEIDGKVQMGYLDPCSVEDVIADKNNIEIIRKVISKSFGSTPAKSYNVIHLDMDPQSKTYGRLVGDIFFFAINKVANARRGRSDLFSIADWIDGYDQFLFNRLERSHLMNVFLWDVTLEGYDQKKIDTWLTSQGLPKPGSLRAHNEKVTWNAVIPKLEAHDASEEAKLFRNQILGGAGLPPHWYAGGEGITRATALEMSTPVIKRLKTRQRFFKHMLQFIFSFVIDQAIIHQKLPPDVDKKVSIFFPKLLEKDLHQASLGIKFILQALEIGLSKGWISDSEAQRAYVSVMSQAGLDLTTKESSGENPNS